MTYRNAIGVCAALLTLTLSGDVCSAQRGAAEAPKLIEWGYDQPSTDFVRKNIAQMETTPFDGTIMAAYGQNGRQKLDLAWEAWGKTGFTHEEFQQAVDDLKATPFHRFTDNFLRINVTPGDVDWFDDAGWANICKNGDVAGWICKEGHLKGLMFDTEMYTNEKYHDTIFTYAARPGRATHSFTQYRDEARKRGQEFARALTGEKPDAVILFTYATAYRTFGDTDPEQSAMFGLLPAFIDGMLEGADQRAQLVDAMEPSYGVKEQVQFGKFRAAVRDAKNLSMAPQVYSKRMKTGFGLWLDKNWRDVGWDPNNTAKNYFQPSEFQKTVNLAMQSTDQYVWVYSEEMNWWTRKGTSAAYIDAIAKGREEGLAQYRKKHRISIDPFTHH